MNNLTKLIREQLKKMCVHYDIKGVSNSNKQQMIQKINDHNDHRENGDLYNSDSMYYYYMLHVRKNEPVVNIVCNKSTLVSTTIKIGINVPTTCISLSPIKSKWMKNYTYKKLNTPGVIL
jgi:hypothetical protein